MSNKKIYYGPCVVTGHVELFTQAPCYFCATGERLDPNYLFNALGNPEFLCYIPLEPRKAYMEQRKLAMDVIEDIEKNGTCGKNVSYIYR